ncbi:Stp1/IreP family PP2C-type Ser/Thr phosphatase [Noviherbaspirillum massiliense]|uniref:Stp1/IreP family PP2C-type Ser/Thr phosphatase n=1 Tax=Noviherbaspirillum massiliense TaxID=1465823 RepID=UPI0002E023FD|nr:Stp1/IreP family PP2C-type Ser/Thr phosphatase [Noviherbaspirillum massiliense]
MLANAALEFAEKTDTGLVRSQNEDAIALSPEYGFAILADGMGGYNAGEVASNIATTVFKESMEAGLSKRPNKNTDLLRSRSRLHQQLIVDAIQQANLAIVEAAHAQPRYRGMGTTLVAALFHQNKVTIAHVGDSRAYRFRKGELTQITRDHSLVQEQIDAGQISPEMARFSSHRNLVTRAVGVNPKLDVEVHDHEVEEGDIYLLCSDGLSDMISDQGIHDTIVGFGPSLKTICATLVRMANENGGRDNISVVLTRVGASDVKSANPKPAGLLGRFLSWNS